MRTRSFRPVQKASQAGFSLIEIIVVVVLIGGIVAFAASKILGGQDRVDGADIAAILIGNRLRRGGHGVGHGHQFGRSIPRHRLGMDLANAPCPQKSEPNCHFRPLRHPPLYMMEYLFHR